jgi:hypothetical protein
MKRAVFSLLILAVVSLAGAAIWQQQIIQQQQKQLADFQRAQAQQTATTAKLSALQQRNDLLAAEAKQLRSKLAKEESGTPAPVATAPEPKAEAKADKSPMAAYLKMLKDPKMREMIRSQQRMAMPMLYADFVKQLGLSADDANKLYDLLADKQLAQMNQGLDAMGAGDSANGADPKQAEQDATDALKQFLGDSNYAQFQDYQKTAGERMQLNQFSQSLTGQNALNDSQRQGLLQIMTAERAKAPASILASSTDGSASDKMAALSNPDTVNQFITNQENTNANILAHATGLLNPDQITALKSYQDNLIQMQKLGMQMMSSGSSTPAP